MRKQILHIRILKEPFRSLNGSLCLLPKDNEQRRTKEKRARRRTIVKEKERKGEGRKGNEQYKEKGEEGVGIRAGVVEP